MNEFVTVNLLDVPVYYINLKRDTEKSKMLESKLLKLGFKNINRFDGIENEVKKVGVALSHNALLKQLSDKDTPFIIFEDDIDVVSFFPTISVPTDADAFYLGNSAFGLYSGVGQKKISLEHYEEDVYRVYNMLAAHAILYLNREYVKFLAKATEFSLYVKDNQDKARAETMKYWNVYANDIPMFYQRGVHQQVTSINIANTRSVGPDRAYGR
jgi:hypothetical protein